MWDVLCNIDTGKITIHKDIKIPSITSSASASTLGLVPRTGFITVVAEEEINKANPAQREGANAKADFTARPDNADNQFMDEVSTPTTFGLNTQELRFR